MTGPTAGDRGFVLLNALLIVAALAGAAALLLARAEGARNRAALDQEVTQTRLYLDGFEALAITVLDRDAVRGATDDLSEEWARTEYAVPVDRGALAGRVSDLQGRFNINWLSGAESEAARVGFEGLCGGLGLSEARITAILDYLSNDISLNAAQSPPRRPRGGPIDAIEELRFVPGLTTDEFDRLLPLVAALPKGTPLNVNTAPSVVLQALLPAGAREAVGGLILERTSRPFETVEDFLARLQDRSDLDPEELAPERFSVESNWFLVESSARLGATEIRRRTVIQRTEPVGRAMVIRRTRVLQ